MNKKQRSEINRKNALLRWSDGLTRFEIMARLSKYIEKGNFWDHIDTWPTTYLMRLLKYYERGNK